MSSERSPLHPPPSPASASPGEELFGARLRARGDYERQDGRWFAVALGSLVAMGFLIMFTTHTGNSTSSSSQTDWPDVTLRGKDKKHETIYFPGAKGTERVSELRPLSTARPIDLGLREVERPKGSRPSAAWGKLRKASFEGSTSLETNSWWENIVLGEPTQEGSANAIVSLPYAFDASGTMSGLRMHCPGVQASSLAVLTVYDWRQHLLLGAEGAFGNHTVVEPGPLALTLLWEEQTKEVEEIVTKTEKKVAEARARAGGDTWEQAALEEEINRIEADGDKALGKLHRAVMSAPVVRGMPFGTVEYFDAKPVISSVQAVVGESIRVDGKLVSCKHSKVHIKSEAEIHFAYSDHTWLVFVSQPTTFLCNVEMRWEHGDPPVPGGVGELVQRPYFTLTAEDEWERGVVRAALANNCTSGASTSTQCDTMWNGQHKPRDNSAFMKRLRTHHTVYPTGDSRVGYVTGSEGKWVWAGGAIQELKDGEEEGKDSSDSSSLDETEITDRLASPQDDADGAKPSSKWLRGTPKSEATLRFIWGERRMDGKDALALPEAVVAPEGGSIHLSKSETESDPTPTRDDKDQLLMFALPHHLEALETEGVLEGGTATLHGFAKLVKGDRWDMRIDLPAVELEAKHKIRDEMLDDVNAALDVDLSFDTPDNYKRGAGDTYFSGKLLAKMGRIAMIAEEVGRHDEAMVMAKRMLPSIEIWYDPDAEAPLLYDKWWGGVMAAGCDFDGETQTCTNDISKGEYPALTDVGQNFGAGFYNDHHFHYGYHIYAAAIASYFYPEWGAENYEKVLLLIRDIANPSPDDPYFPQFRHKDWYLGSSWALGIPTLGGVPYSNGRNQESSSEAVNAYDAITLYGEIMTRAFASLGDLAGANAASHVRATGRMLTGTEIRSAQVYWHVREPGSPGTPRVYPEVYEPKVVGMLWSTLAQMQTWFGSAPYLVFGIQILPLTAVSGKLLEKEWVSQMIDDLGESCFPNGDPTDMSNPCVESGWSINYHAVQAINDDWQGAWEGVQSLPHSVFEGPGGDGHSRSNTLWFIATRGDES